MKFRIIRGRHLIIFIGDIICLIAGLFIALAIRFGISDVTPQFAIHRIPFTIIFILWLLLFYSGGLYSVRTAKNNRAFFTLFFTLFAINAGIAVFFFYFVPYFAISPKVVMFLDIGVTAVLLLGWRSFFNHFISSPPLKLAIIGEGPEVNELIEDLKRHPQQGYHCVLHLAHPPADLAHVLRNNHIDVVAVATDYRRSADLQKSLFECIPLQIQFFDFVKFYEQLLQKIPLITIDRAWFLENLNEPAKQFFSRVKRIGDIVITLALSIIGMALSPFIAIAILIDSGRPILYSQMRTGQFGKPFRIYKFRTMAREADESSVTSVGRFLRATHFDEIPQLWNILKGDMSFVGPRPEMVHLVEQLQQKIPFYTERLLVQPGITGWAQLHEPRARADDALSKLQYDLFYVKHRSLLFDLEIILKTLRILIG